MTSALTLTVGANENLEVRSPLQAFIVRLLVHFIHTHFVLEEDCQIYSEMNSTCQN